MASIDDPSAVDVVGDRRGRDDRRRLEIQIQETNRDRDGLPDGMGRLHLHQEVQFLRDHDDGKFHENGQCIRRWSYP